ncbi:TolC family protein [Parasulfitobacter algicola]|uniref:TolC family protein n=1 Tax=Parasulfitobacter algicola TaxID=2614809 RepID=A0ABX2IXX9_9RHOB|nr:TolC family protein [Sulfitobacter algicola]NSX55404.1 TolC family protein [Sulfitobacter algicola]
MRIAALLLSVALSGCALPPDLDGRPTDAVRAADLAVSEASVWSLDFGDAGLRRMLTEADIGGLDVAAARARARAADLALAQARASTGLRLGGSSRITAGTETQFGPDNGGETETRRNIGIELTAEYEPDLTGRLDAALAAARLEWQAEGLDLFAARRTLAKAVTEAWIALAEARTQATRAAEQVRLTEAVIPALRARAEGGESTGADLASRLQDVTQARVTAAEATGRVALAEARLRALGVQTIPGRIPLRDLRRPAIAARTDLSRVANRPDVCAAWLRFRAADAERAAVLRDTRPRLVVTGSLASTSRTLAGLLAGNAAVLASTVRLEGTLLDDGTARRQVDRARLGVASAEIAWLRARMTAEITALEASVDLQAAEARLTARLASYRLLAADLDRVRARRNAGLDGDLELAESRLALANAQTDIDAARATAFRAAVERHDAMGSDASDQNCP